MQRQFLAGPSGTLLVERLGEENHKFEAKLTT